MNAASTSQRVLLIEDDENSRRTLRMVLEEEGFVVQVAADGQEGVELVPSFCPDVVILDLALPRLNGFDAADALKQNTSTSGIPLVAVTASWLGSESALLREFGFVTALRKPIAAERLVEELRKILPGQSGDAFPLLVPSP
jgi:CheY-like chemotaxis protein